MGVFWGGTFEWFLFRPSVGFGARLVFRIPFAANDLVSLKSWHLACGGCRLIFAKLWVSVRSCPTPPNNTGFVIKIFGAGFDGSFYTVDALDFLPNLLTVCSHLFISIVFAVEKLNSSSKFSPEIMPDCPRFDLSGDSKLDRFT